MSRSQFLTLVLAGTLIRAAALAGPGTGDLTIWKVWSYNAARHGVAGMYGVGGTPLEHRELEYAGATATVDYPPLALWELGAAGQAYWLWSHHRFPNATPLNAFVKLPSVAAEVGLTLLLFALVRARLGVSAARLAAAAYWLNPAALFDASILGYLDAQYVLPAIAALAAAAAGWPAAAGALIAAAILTKAQGLFIAPAVAAAIWTTGAPEKRGTRLLAAFVGGLGVTIAVVAPVAIAGGWPNMMQALGRLATHDMLSANATNLWWVIGYLLRVRYSAPDMGLWAAITAPAKILGIRRVIEIGYPDPRAIGIALTVAAIAWALWTVSRAPRATHFAPGTRHSAPGTRHSAPSTRDLAPGTRHLAPGTRHLAPGTSLDLWLLAGVAGFCVHAYATLSAQVHENHLFAAVPLLVLAAAGRPGFRPIAAGVSAVVALNLNLFYGFGDGIGYALPRAITIVDLTVVAALINCLLLSWHAVVLSRQGSTADARLPPPAPA